MWILFFFLIFLHLNFRIAYFYCVYIDALYVCEMTLQRVLLHLQTELGVLFLFCFSAFGFPLGSPVTPDACVQLVPRHSQQVFINNPSAYSLSLSTQYYRFCDDPAFCGKNYIIGKHIAGLSK